MTTHEVLVVARNLIDREGHLKADLGGPGRGYCANGAINMATTGHAEPLVPRSAVNVAAREALVAAHGCGDNLTFNNAPERTKDEVLAAFDAAINLTAPPPPEVELAECAEALV